MPDAKRRQRVSLFRTYLQRLESHERVCVYQLMQAMAHDTPKARRTPARVRRRTPAA